MQAGRRTGTTAKRGSEKLIQPYALAWLAITMSAIMMGLSFGRLEARHKLVAAVPLNDCSRNTAHTAHKQGGARLLLSKQPIKNETGKTLPYIVQRMQAKAVDWHAFVENSRTPTDNDPDFPIVPARSRTSALRVGAFISGLEFEQHMFGPLADYAGCRVLDDPCAIHGLQATCLMDAFCGWCERSSVCLSREKQQQHCAGSRMVAWDTSGYLAAYRAHPEIPFKIASGGTLRAGSSISECKHIVPGVILEPTFLENTMLHHWHADAWPGIVQQWWAAVDSAQQLQGSKTILEQNKPIQGYATILKEGRHILPNQRFLYTSSHRTTFFDHLGLLSPHCPMQKEKIPDGTCFVTEIPSLGPFGRQVTCAGGDCIAKVSLRQVVKLHVYGLNSSDPVPLSRDPFEIIVQRLQLEGIGAEQGSQQIM